MQPACRASSHGSRTKSCIERVVDVNSHAIAVVRGQRKRESPNLPSSVCPPSLTAPNQYRRDLGCLSRRPTEASRWNRAPATGHSINNSGGRQTKEKNRRDEKKRRQLGLSEESAQHTRTPKSTPRAAYAAPHCSLQQLHERRSLAGLPSPRSVDWNEPADCCHSARIPKQLCYTERRAALSFRSTKSTQTRGWPGGDVTPRPSPPLFRAKNCNDEGRTGKQKRRTRTIRRRKTPINVHRTQKPAFIDVGCKLARLQSSFQGSGW